MRIITGKFKSRLITSPKGVYLRPTADRVKESLFGILGAFVIDKNVLDLFSGTGNLGIEALSRGAKSCVFVDNNPRCIAAIKKNLESLGINPVRHCCSKMGANGVSNGVKGEAEVVLRDVFKYIKEAKEKGPAFDLVLLDPPYYKDMVKKSLILLDDYNIITRLSVIGAQHYRKDELPQPDKLRNLILFRQEKYGVTFLSFYKK